MKSYFFFIVLCGVIRCYGHERVYTNDEITRMAAFIVDGVIIDEKLISEERQSSPEGEMNMLIEKFEYKFKILNIIRGEHYVNNDELTMSQTIVTGDGFPEDKKYSIGDHIRYFRNLGQFKNGKFEPFSGVIDGRMKSFSYEFSISSNYGRAELYGKPLNAFKNAEDVNALNRLERPPPKSEIVDEIESINGGITKPEIESENKDPSSFVYLLIGLTIIILVIILLISQRKSQDKK